MRHHDPLEPGSTPIREPLSIHGIVRFRDAINWGEGFLKTTSAPSAERSLRAGPCSCSEIIPQHEIAFMFAG
jgi:hypothetical protein